jgi:fructan beta-fructosidase
MKTFWIVICLASLGACLPEKSITEPFRPTYHFTPLSGWMNDPNGMFFYEGEYHLFYQHYPDSTVWGPMHWGHAVSKDMLNWEHLPIALYPDSIGYIFSGSAVIDWENTSGFGTTNNPPIVAIFTYHNMDGEKLGHNDFQTQGIAYSLDKGRTWTKYVDNPVLKNPGIKDFRDPKVSWNDVAGQWVMTLAVKDHIEFYSSPDLKNWSKLSEFGNDLGAHGGVWECPDLFSLKDEAGKPHWVLLVSINPGGPQGGSATQYFIGDFDGKKFMSQDTITRWIDYGADNYAGVTWSDIPQGDGRRLFIGWMSNWQYAQVVPATVWRSAMTLPREIMLRKLSAVYELNYKPIDELTKYLGNPKCSITSASFSGPVRISFSVGAEQEFSFNLSNEKDEKVLILLEKRTLVFDRTNAGLSDFNNEFPARHSVDIGSTIVSKVDIFIDATSTEIFINDGEVVLTELVFPSGAYTIGTLTKPNTGYCIRSINL